MLTRNPNEKFKFRGFTLLELILVMTLMVVIVSFIAPSLAHSFRQRGLDQEAVRVLAMTEYGRDEAVSTGIPTQVWIDPNSGSFGVEAAPGYTDNTITPKQYTLPDNFHFDTGSSSKQTTQEGYIEVIGFDPDGAPTDQTGMDSVRILDQENNSVLLSLTDDGWGYEIVKEAANGSVR